MAEHKYSTETLMQAMVKAVVLQMPDLPVTKSEPAWSFEEGAAGPTVSEERATTASVEELPFFFLTRNGRPVLFIERHGGSHMTGTPVYVEWTGPEDENPERFYEQMEDL